MRFFCGQKVGGSQGGNGVVGKSNRGLNINIVRRTGCIDKIIYCPFGYLIVELDLEEIIVVLWESGGFYGK